MHIRVRLPSALSPIRPPSLLITPNNSRKEIMNYFIESSFSIIVRMSDERNRSLSVKAANLLHILFYISNYNFGRYSLGRASRAEMSASSAADDF